MDQGNAYCPQRMIGFPNPPNLTNVSWNSPLPHSTMEELQKYDFKCSSISTCGSWLLALLGDIVKHLRIKASMEEVASIGAYLRVYGLLLQAG